MFKPNRPSSPETAHCGTFNASDALVASSGLDAFEQRLLELIRLKLAHMAGPKPRYSAEIKDIAAAFFGAQAAPQLLEATMHLVAVMAHARSEQFHYANPYCEGCARILTREEGHLMRLIHHARRGQKGHSYAQALMLCESKPVSEVIRAADALGQLALVQMH